MLPSFRPIKDKSREDSNRSGDDRREHLIVKWKTLALNLRLTPSNVLLQEESGLTS